MPDQRQTRAIRRTVRRVRNYWYRAGVPRRVRRDKAEELQAHLHETVRNGGRIEQVVGDDVAAFASAWARAERPRPLLDVGLQAVAAVTLLPGGLALLNPWLSAAVGQGDPRIGFPVGILSYVAAIVPAVIGWQLIRVLRHRLTTQQTAMLGLLLAVGYLVVFAVAISRVGDTDAFVVLPTATAWTLVLVGAVSQGAAVWTKRR